MIKLHRSTDNQFYFTVCGRNGKVILTSETYKTRDNALRGIVAMDNALMHLTYSNKEGTILDWVKDLTK